jgi:hypothetical protein
MQVGGDIEDLVVRGVNLDHFRMRGGSDELGDIDPVFVVEGDQGRDQIGAGFAPFAALPVAISAGGVIGGKAAFDGVSGIDFESRASAWAGRTSAASATAGGRACWGLSGGRLRLLCGEDADEGECSRKSKSFVNVHLE